MAEAEFEPRGIGARLAEGAPLLLAALGGPIGFAAGLLGTGLLRERGKEQDKLGAKEFARQQRADAFGGGPVSGQALPELLDRAYQMEAGGYSSDVIKDQIDYLQAQAGKIADEERAAAAPLGFNVGTYNPRDYTSSSWAAAQRVYQETGDAVKASEKLERFDEPKDPFGPVGQGMYRTQRDDGSVVDVPVPGSPEYARRVAPIQATKQAMDVATQLINEIEATGGESFGGAGKKQNLLYNQMLSVLGQLTNAGVLQQGELERFAASLPNPTDFFGGMRTNKTLTDPYYELQRQLQLRLADQVGNLSGELTLPEFGTPEEAGPPPPPPGFILRQQ